MAMIKDLRAGEFIDIDNYYREFADGINDSELLFFDILKVKKPTTEKEYLDFFEDYDKQIIEIKESFQFVYNPPPLPSTLSNSENTIGAEHRREFSEIYGGYVENVYILSTTFRKLPNEILEMNIIDFLFWANYLNHKKWCEQIK